MLKRRMFTLSLTLCSLTAFGANENTGQVEITSIENWSATEALLVTTNQVTKNNPASCSAPGKYSLPASSSDFSRSMLLSAFATNKQVMLTIWDGGCVVNNPQIVSVKFSN